MIQKIHGVLLLTTLENAQVSITTGQLKKDDLSVAHYQRLRGEFPNSSFTNDVSPFIERLRLYKTPEEIKKLQGAGAEADFAFKIGFDAIRTGVTERSIAGQIDYQLKIQKRRNA